MIAFFIQIVLIVKKALLFYDRYKGPKASTESGEMDKQRRKSVQRKAKAIFEKAEDREKAGGNYFETGWQATLELMLLMMEDVLLESPDQLLPLQISDDNEWEFYLDIMEKLDLPPNTGAVLVTPSAFKDMKLPGLSEFEDSEMAPWERNAYSLIVSHLQDHTIILQASLPGIEFAGGHPSSHHKRYPGLTGSADFKSCLVSSFGFVELIRFLVLSRLNIAMQYLSIR